MIRDTGSTQLSKPASGPRFARTNKMIKTVKYKLDQKAIVTVRGLAKGHGISKSSSNLILRDDLKLHAYKMTRCVSSFQMKKRFNLDGLYSSQNQCVWVASRDEADEQEGIKMRQKFPQNFLVWLGVCFKGVTPIVILD